MTVGKDRQACPQERPRDCPIWAQGTLSLLSGQANNGKEKYSMYEYESTNRRQIAWDKFAQVKAAAELECKKTITTAWNKYVKECATIDKEIIAHARGGHALTGKDYLE
jgi:hypothetical protein